MINSIDKAMKVMDLLCGYPRGLRLNELSEKLQINQSTLHHILATLLPYGYVQQDINSRKYMLGYRHIDMSNIIIDNMEIRSITHKYLENLGHKIKGVAHISILDNDKLMYVDKTEWTQGMLLATYIGFTTEPYVASGGKVLLAQLDEQRIDRLFAGVKFKQYTAKTVKNLDELKRQLQIVRMQGFAVDDEEYYDGVRCIAVPTFIRGSIPAALSVTASVFMYTYDELISEICELVLQTAKKISTARN